MIRPTPEQFDQVIPQGRADDNRYKADSRDLLKAMMVDGERPAELSRRTGRSVDTLCKLLAKGERHVVHGLRHLTEKQGLELLALVGLTDFQREVASRLLIKGAPADEVALELGTDISQVEETAAELLRRLFFERYPLMLEAEFETRVSWIQLSQRGQKCAHAVLVEGKRPSDVARTFAVSPQKVSMYVGRVRRARAPLSDDAKQRPRRREGTSRRRLPTWSAEAFEKAAARVHEVDLRPGQRKEVDPIRAVLVEERSVAEVAAAIGVTRQALHARILRFMDLVEADSSATIGS